MSVVSARVSEAVEVLCYELGVEPRNVKQIQIDEASVSVETYVIDPDGVDAIDHRRRPAFARTHYLWRFHLIGTAKGEAQRV